MKDVIAFILAGGKSSRMGEDKAFLQLEGRTLLARALELARSVCGEVQIVGSSQKFFGFAPTVEDIFRDQGPLAGIHAALKNTSADLSLVLAVDMPFLEAPFLRYLLAQAAAGKAVVTVPRCAGGWQPLCAVYRREFIQPAENALRQARNKIDPLFAQVPTRVIEESELLKLGLTPEIFRNLNTPKEFNQAQSRRH